MPNPARFALERPRIVALATALLVVFGALSYRGLPRQENPTLEDRFAEILTYLPGAAPDKVELLVTKVLEERIAEVDDIEDLFSVSARGVSFVMVELEKSAPAAERLQEVRDKVQEARLALPPGASEPDVDLRVLRTNTLVLALAGRGVPLVALREQAQELERALERLPDVRRVDLVGVPEEEIDVAVDLRRLSQRALPLSRVIDALAARNVQLPSGELEVGAVRSTIHTSGAFGGPRDVASTYLAAGANGLPVRLADVADVSRRLADPEVRVRASGERAVGIAIEMLPQRNAIALGERVRALLAEHPLPEGMRVAIAADEPAYVDARLSLLTQSLLIGLALVVCLTLVGMGWRSGLVVSVTIPLALTVAFGLQGLAGVPLHQISIAALVIAIGIVVDESIVVTDNIQRHLDRGEEPKTAAIRGLGEIHLAVLAGAATTVAAFIPLMVMEGDIGDFIRSIPIVVSLMLVGSVLVAHFVTPLLAVALHAPTAGATGGRRRPRVWDRIEPRYLPVLRFAVARPRTVLAMFAAAIPVTILVAGPFLWPPAFFPDADRHQFLVKVDLPSGAPLEETDAVVARVEEHLARHPAVRDWTAFIGRDAPKFYYNEFDDGRAENRAQIIVNTHESVAFHETRGVVEALRRDLVGSVAGARIRAHPLKQGYGNAEDIEIFVTGDSLEVLRALAARIRTILEDTPGVRNVRDSFGYDPVTLQMRVDDAKANLLGISHRDVASTLRLSIDGVTATTVQEEDEEIAVRVSLAEGQRRRVTDLAGLPLYSPVTARAVPLAHVGSLEPGFTHREILRFDRKREAEIEAEVAPGESLLTVAAEVERAVRERIALPPGYEAAFFGQPREVTESFLSLAKAAVVAVFLIYIILVVRFGSLQQPTLILLAVPMSLVGATWGLALTGNPLAFMSFLGAISLTGIAVNDSIVLVDTVNRLRSGGTPLEEAVLEGTRSRLRAVLLTSVTTIGGLLPLSLSGGELWAPFGFAMIFGLMGATVLTLVVQPAAYLTLERRSERRSERRGAPATG